MIEGTGRAVDHAQTDVTSPRDIHIVTRVPPATGGRSHIALCLAAGAIWEPGTIPNRLDASESLD
jgi:hypothetical protein